MATRVQGLYVVEIPGKLEPASVERFLNALDVGDAISLEISTTATAGDGIYARAAPKSRLARPKTLSRLIGLRLRQTRRDHLAATRTERGILRAVCLKSTNPAETRETLPLTEVILFLTMAPPQTRIASALSILKTSDDVFRVALNIYMFQPKTMSIQESLTGVAIMQGLYERCAGEGIIFTSEGRPREILPNTTLAPGVPENAGNLNAARIAQLWHMPSIESGMDRTSDIVANIQRVIAQKSG